jgi:hypothetical protein
MPIIYNSKYDNDGNLFDKRSSNSTTSVAISSSPYATPPSHSSTKIHQNYYYNEYHKVLVELAKGFLKLLSSQLVDNIMVAAVKEKP